MKHVSLDPVAITEELGLARPRHAVAVDGGSHTAIWRVATDDGQVAVRVFPPSQELALQRERQALAAAHAAGIPVPTFLAAGAPDSAGGRPVVILQWCEGVTMLDELVRRPDRAGSLGALLGRTQAAIHRAAPPREWGPRGGDALLHLDLHPLNVLVDAHGVSAVLDWVNAGSGDARTDVARTYAILTADPGAVAFQRRAPSVARAFRHGWRAGYEGAEGPLVDMGSHIAAAGGWMQRDLAARLDSPALANIERWAAGWRRHARGRYEAPLDDA